MCSRYSGYAENVFAFDSKLKLEQSVCYNRSRPPENYTKSSVYPNSQDVSDLGNAFRLSIKTRSLIIKLPNDCPVFILFFNTWYIFLWDNTRPKSIKVSRYFHCLFCTLIVIFALHESTNVKYCKSTSYLCAIKVVLETAQHPLYLHSFGISLENGKYTWTKLNWILFRCYEELPPSFFARRN